MPEPKRNPLSSMFMAAAATAAATAVAVIARPWSARRLRNNAASAVAAVRGKPDARQWSPELLRQLEWRRFEELCVAYYEALGAKPRIDKSAAHGGVSIHLHEQASERTTTLVQCKAWDAYRVGTKAVRELRAALAAAKVSDGVLITSGRFTQEAANAAAKEGVQLLDGAALLARLAALPPETSMALLRFATQGDFVTPTCPVCSVKMVSRQSTREGRKFWGCKNYPGCKHTFSGTASAPA